MSYCPLKTLLDQYAARRISLNMLMLHNIQYYSWNYGFILLFGVVVGISTDTALVGRLQEKDMNGPQPLPEGDHVNLGSTSLRSYLLTFQKVA